MAYALFAATKRYDLTMAIMKTAPGTTLKDPEIKIDNKTLKNIDAFTFLGCTLASNNSLDKEISNRIVNLRKRVWTETNYAVYRVLVLSALLY